MNDDIDPNNLTDKQTEQVARLALRRGASYVVREDAEAILRLLDAERARVARMLDLGRYWNGPGHGPGRWDSSHAIELRAAAEGTLDWSGWEETWRGAAQERGLCNALPHEGHCHYSHLLGDD